VRRPFLRKNGGCRAFQSRNAGFVAQNRRLHRPAGGFGEQGTGKLVAPPPRALVNPPNSRWHDCQKAFSTPAIANVSSNLGEAPRTQQVREFSYWANTHRAVAISAHAMIWIFVFRSNHGPDCSPKGPAQTLLDTSQQRNGSARERSPDPFSHHAKPQVSKSPRT